LVVLFLINAIDSSIITAKSGRITQVENSETGGVGEGDRVEVGEAELELAGIVIVCVLLQSLELDTNWGLWNTCGGCE